MDKSERSQEVTTDAAARESWWSSILGTLKAKWDATGRSLTQNVMMGWGVLSLILLPGQWIYNQLSLNDATALVILFANAMSLDRLITLNCHSKGTTDI